MQDKRKNTFNKGNRNKLRCVDVDRADDFPLLNSSRFEINKESKRRSRPRIRPTRAQIRDTCRAFIFKLSNTCAIRFN